MSFEDRTLRCRNCKYWWPTGDVHDAHLREHATRGQCRRHAPPPVAADQEWAYTQYDDWCGEHSHVSA